MTTPFNEQLHCPKCNRSYPAVVGLDIGKEKATVRCKGKNCKHAWKVMLPGHASIR